MGATPKKAPPGGPAQVRGSLAKSLARTTHRIAISNERLTSLHDGAATFAVRNNEQGGPRKRQERLPASGFIPWRRAQCIAPVVQPRISEFSHPTRCKHLIKRHGIFPVPMRRNALRPTALQNRAFPCHANACAKSQPRNTNQSTANRVATMKKQAGYHQKISVGHMVPGMVKGKLGLRLSLPTNSPQTTT
jgi:Putative transposase